MLGFFFRKNFYDGWDNVIYLFLPNLLWDVCIGLTAALSFAGYSAGDNATLGLSLWIAAAIIFFISGGIFSCAWAECASSIADYEVCGPKEFFSSLKHSIADGIRYGLLLLIFTVLFVTGLIFYFKRETLEFIDLAAGSVYAWIGLAIYMGLFWYPSLRAQLKNSFGKTLKKCFIFLLDNLGKSIILGIYNVFLFLISIVLMGLAPGLGGIGLARCNMARLLLKKYDFLEELQKKGEKAPKLLPWADILKEDVELTGERTFKQFIFPWKDK